MNPERCLGFLRTCMDRRFVDLTRKTFEEKTGLGPNDYWHDSYAGGSAIQSESTIDEDYAAEHGATVFGWQAHGDHCGGQPGVGDSEIEKRLDRTIKEKKRKFSNGRRFRIFAKENGIEIKEV